ncbi:MAG: hypothetical protein P4L40_21550 [Terracidiphilus sp.]|nr:hypothetical protein [Terracidiphilus sp.]
MPSLSKQRAGRVYPAEGGFRVLTRASMEMGEQHERLGIWRREYDPTTGEWIGWRVLGEEARKVDSDLCTMHSTAAISANEMQTNAERSATYGLREEQRLERMASGRQPEDRVERVQAKVRVYAVIGSAQGDILRVWPR